jgi:hypothetical protein
MGRALAKPIILLSANDWQSVELRSRRQLRGGIRFDDR